MLSFAESCTPWMREVSKQPHQQFQPNAMANTPTAPVFVTPGGIALGPTGRLTASACTTARMPAPSRALMLLPSLPVCPAAFATSVLIVEAQHTLTVHPRGPMLKFLGQASARMQYWYCNTIPAAADIAVAPSLSDLVCNETLMCCMVDSFSQPQLMMSTAHAPRTFAAWSPPPRRAATGSPYADILPDLRSWSWLQTLIMGAFMFSLGFIIPGTFLSRYRCFVVNHCTCVRVL